MKTTKEIFEEDALNKIKTYSDMMKDYGYNFWDFEQEPRPEINLDFFNHWLSAREYFYYIKCLKEFFHFSLEKLEEIIPK